MTEIQVRQMYGQKLWRSFTPEEIILLLEVYSDLKKNDEIVERDKEAEKHRMEVWKNVKEKIRISRARRFRDGWRGY